MATNYEVVQAQRDFADARNNELRAILNYRKALVNFETVQTVGHAASAAVTGGGTATAGAVAARRRAVRTARPATAASIQSAHRRRRHRTTLTRLAVFERTVPGPCPSG